MMTYAFDGVLDFSNNQDFVYKVALEENALKSYEKDTLIMSAIKDRLLFNQRDVLLESIVINALYPSCKENFSISFQNSETQFDFLCNILFSTKLLAPRFKKFTVLDLNKRLNLMNFSSLKFQDNLIYLGDDSYRINYF